MQETVKMDMPSDLYFEQAFIWWHIYRLPLLSCIFILFALRVLSLQYGKKRDTSISKSHPDRVTSAESKVEVLSSSAKSANINDNAKQRHPSQSAVLKKGPKRIVVGTKPVRKRSPNRVQCNDSFKIKPLVFYASLTGTCEKYAKDFVSALALSPRIEEPQLHDLAYIDFDDFFITPPSSTPSEGETKSTVRYFYLILIPSYNIDSILNTFLDHLQETHNDFRVDTAPLSALAGYSVFGIGDKEGWPSEKEGFCYQAVEVDKWMAKLTGKKRAFPLGTGDVKADASSRLDEWRKGIEDVMRDILANGDLGDGVEGSGDAVESDEEDIDVGAGTGEGPVQDLEDISPPSTSATANPKMPLLVDFTTRGTTVQMPTPAPKEMVPLTSPTHAALTKQGYSIIGSHSGVKICRWTKSALRGRGSCYKYSFYGIKSHLCMEATPSLSCSNKCVFCWRHGTNPVGTTWRWAVDPPDLIFAGAKAAHYKKIKMLKGVPGVRSERFAEAMQIRHCALSLVGEPIFYPRINEFISLLHREHISTFLVCNAQHPAQLAALQHVTQLYVSIDASNAAALRRIDRPLHRDFWERFLDCMDILRAKRQTQRTVFRLTLVKGFNIDAEARGYADLVARALPCFIEIKGVTYCGTSSSASAGLTMKNVPFYDEVVAFSQALVANLRMRGLPYDLAAEHAHSCCVLVGDEQRFKRDGRWHTIIDYDKFFSLLEEQEEFGPEDYVGAETPEWAVWGSGRGGFDPRDTRVDRKGRRIETV